MKDAAAVYLVRFWIKPGHEAAVLDWLDKGHIADVVGQPGFLWARRFRLEGADADGWPAFSMVYGLDSIDALHAYFASEAPKRYAKERETLGIDALLRTDRDWGVAEYAVDA